VGAATGYLMLATTIVLSVVAWRRWSTLFDAWWAKREEKAEEFADLLMTDLFILIDILPRKGRRVVKPVTIWIVILLFGVVHFVVVWDGLAGGIDLGRWLLLHYLWTLAFWLGLLALPAHLTAQHRVAMRVAASSRQGEA
jgi:hypothetical protein